MTCPFLTMLLKSAPSHWMLPETWLPTWTVVTACSVPVAPTVSTMSPRLIGAVVTWISGLFALGIPGADAAADHGQQHDRDDRSLHAAVYSVDAAAFTAATVIVINHARHQRRVVGEHRPQPALDFGG